MTIGHPVVGVVGALHPPLSSSPAGCLASIAKGTRLAQHGIQVNVPGNMGASRCMASVSRSTVVERPLHLRVCRAFVSAFELPISTLD